MTVICCKCREGLGERCPYCGVEAKESLLIRGSHVCRSELCGLRYFYAGLGGISHGYCEACLKDAMVSVHSA